MESECQKEVEYREIEGYPKYRVGDDGSVWSIWSGLWKRLNPCPITGGYLKAVLYDGFDNHKDVLVHALVLTVFVGPMPDGMEGCHFDGDPSNNALSNLRWDTPKNNKADSARHGTLGRSPGERNGHAKLVAAEVLEIRRRIASGEKRASLSVLYRVTKQTIDDITFRRSWNHLTAEASL